MQAGDGFAFYSPRESYPEGATLQAFTAIGSVADAPIYETTMPELGKIYRRDVAFFQGFRAMPGRQRPARRRLSGSSRRRSATAAVR